MGLGIQPPGSGVLIRGRVGEYGGQALGAASMRELVESICFLRGWGVSVVWVLERLGAGEMGFVVLTGSGSGWSLSSLPQVLDMAADSFLAGLVSVLDPPDTWVPSHLDLQPGE